MASLPQLIHRTVQICGSKAATRCSGRTHTWTEFQQRISRLAGGLHSLGVKEGDRAACLTLNSDRYLEFYFGVAWSGAVFVVDRVKDMIVSGGENVYSAETEQAMYTHPAIAECAVIGIPHDSWGEQVHAIVHLKAGELATEPELIDHCKTLIAAFKCPKSIEFREDPLPLSGAGKILKKDLRAVYWEGRDRNVG